jgi:hypothetical protein
MRRLPLDLCVALAVLAACHSSKPLYPPDWLDAPAFS